MVWIFGTLHVVIGIGLSVAPCTLHLASCILHLETRIDVNCAGSSKFGISLTMLLFDLNWC